MNKSPEFKRISCMLRVDQHDRMAKAGINVSGLLRDLIDDHYGQSRVTLQVSPETHSLYTQIVSNSGCTDRDFEPYLKDALKQMIKDRIKFMEKLEKRIR